jgi:DNA primase
MRVLAERKAMDPMEVVTDERQRALLAETLMGETRAPGEMEVFSALQEIQERALESRLRGIRVAIAEAERRGDHVEVAVLSQQKMELDRALRGLHRQKPPEA